MRRRTFSYRSSSFAIVLGAFVLGAWRENILCRCACTRYIKDWEPIGARAKDQESMTRNQGPKVKDQDSRTMEPRTRSQGPRVKDEGPRVKDEESRTNIYIYIYI